MKRSVLFFFLCLFSTAAFAVTWIGGTGNWSNPANWSSGQVPGSNDNVTINSGQVNVNGLALANSIDLNAGATLTVPAGASIRIIGSTALFPLALEGNLSNRGEIIILDAQGSGVSQCLLLSGQLENRGLIRILSEGADALRVTASGSLTNYSDIRVEGVGDGIRSEGSVNNRGSIDISHAWVGIDISSNVFVNSGQIIVAHCESYGIHNSQQGEFSNSGEIRVVQTENNGLRNSGGGLFNNSSTGVITVSDADQSGLFNFDATFQNYGEIRVSDLSGHPLIRNQGDFFHYASGEIRLHQFDWHGISNASLFKNFGPILIDAPNGLIGINNSGNFRNLGQGRIEITGVNNSGINNFAGGLFVNQKAIYLSDIDGTAIKNSVATATFRNRFGGNTHFTNITGSGILNRGVFLNKNATLDFSPSPQSNVDIRNESSFTNNRCGVIRAHERIENSAGAVFNNNAWLHTHHDGTHLNDGNFVNNGVIEDRFGAFSGVSLTNNGVILPPVTGPATVGQPVSDILGLGSLANVTVLGWYTDPQGTTVAGAYDPATNSFTPNANAAGLQTLYVYLLLDYDGSCREYLAVPFEQGIWQPKNLTSGKGTGWRLFPNPAGSTVTLRLPSQDSAEGYTLRLRDTYGRILSQRRLAPGEVRADWDISHLPAGLYAVEVMVGEAHVRTLRLAKR